MGEQRFRGPPVTQAPEGPPWSERPLLKSTNLTRVVCHCLPPSSRPTLTLTVLLKSLLRWIRTLRRTITSNTSINSSKPPMSIRITSPTKGLCTLFLARQPQPTMLLYLPMPTSTMSGSSLSRVCTFQVP